MLKQGFSIAEQGSEQIANVCYRLCSLAIDGLFLDKHYNYEHE